MINRSIQPNSSLHQFYSVPLFNSSQTIQATVGNTISHSMEGNTTNPDLYGNDTTTENDLKHSDNSTHPPSNPVNSL